MHMLVCGRAGNLTLLWTFPVGAMVRVAKEVWKTFEFNLNRARALAQSQHYLEIAVSKGDEAVQAYVQDLLNKTLAFVGFDYGAILRKVMQAVEKPLIVEMEAYMKEHAEAIKARSEELSQMDEKSFTQEFRELVEPFVNLGLLSEQTLRESAVVFAVAALEAFLKDVVSSEIRRRPSTIRLFPEVEKAIDLRVIREYGGKVRIAQAGELARSLDAFHTNTIKSYFKRLYGIPNVFRTRDLEWDITQLLQRRHLIVHRGGIVDHEFKRNTGSRQRLGERIKLPHQTVLRYIEQVRKFGTLISEM